MNLNKRKREEEGFTLLELIIAVGTISALSATGLVVYNNPNTKETIIKSRVDTMAKDGYNAGMAILFTEEKEITIDDALEIAGDRDITLTYQRDGEYGLCINAEYSGKENIQYSSKAGFCEGELTNTEPIDPNTPETPVVMKGQMDSLWNISIDEKCQELTLPISGNVDATIDWGDGSDPIVTTEADPSHLYPAGTGEVSIKIEGSFDNWGSQETAGEESIGWEDSKCIISVNDWFETNTTSLQFAFIDADNLKHIEEIPLSTKSLYGAFYRVDSPFTLGPLNTSQVTDMEAMFHEATKFNQPINFDTSRVTTMHEMFCWAWEFNQPLNFDTSNVRDMTAMFESTKQFNQPLNFDTSRVEKMPRMFYDSRKFNKDLRHWNVDNVTEYELFKDMARKTIKSPIWKH